MKKIKMALYGEPGVGKSVFASKFPKPFFVTTDGNYEWLVDFGADPDAHQEVHSWAEAKKLFKQGFEDYETIVLDLTEDLFMWCENEWCKRNDIEHPSDMAWGKGYQGPRNEFFIEISKLLSLDKHIIMLMHGEAVTVKNKRGVEFTTYRPTSRMPDKLLDQIEGRLRYFLRAYIGSKEVEGKVIKKRFLSLVPKEDEYGIIRGVDENEIPQTIPLEFDVFWNTVIGGEKPIEIKTMKPEEFKEDTIKKTAKKSVVNDGLTDEEREEFRKKMKETNSKYKKEMEELESKNSKTEKVTLKKPDDEKKIIEETKELSKEDKLAALKAKLQKTSIKENVEEIKEESKEDVKEKNLVVTVMDDVKEEKTKELSREDKLAVLKAKLQQMRK